MSPSKTPAPRPSRFHSIFWQAALYVALSLALRVLLLVKFGTDAERAGARLVAMFALGLLGDVAVAACIFLPGVAWTAIARDAWLSRRWWRTFQVSWMWLWWFLALLLLGAEYFFFEEYLSRFNTVAVDYLHYWTEVAGNIGEMYPLKRMTAAAALGAAGVAALMWKVAPPRAGVPVRRRAWGFAAWCVCAAAAVFAVRTSGLRVGPERLANELASNGLVGGTVAMLTRDLEYAAFFPTTDRATAYARAREAVVLPGETFIGPTDSILRRIPGDASRPRQNVVVLIEESLGSEFWGCLSGRSGRKSLTPELDRLASGEGLLFTHLYADGNRTIRGLEAVLASFPPLPGDSILARSRTQGCETLAEVLHRDGYATTFVYPGNGWFDGLRDFALNNGWERMIERKDFTDVAFETTWGASNEDLYGRVLAEARAMHATGRPFFISTMSVSNHQPFTYPAGRIAEPPDKRSRKNAVKYVDWALGKFFAAAKNEPFWKDTIFVVVADHGARVYGAQTIPIHSYEVPLLIIAPGAVPAPGRVETIGCQLDVAPTILGLIGRPYESTFFGRDLRRTPPERARAFLNNNRSVGIYGQQRLVTFGLNKVLDAYAGDILGRKFTSLPKLDATSLSLAAEATAVFQTADDLYMNHRYALPAARAVEPQTNAPAAIRHLSAVSLASPRAGVLSR